MGSVLLGACAGAETPADTGGSGSDAHVGSSGSDAADESGSGDPASSSSTGGSTTSASTGSTSTSGATGTETGSDAGSETGSTSTSGSTSGDSETTDVATDEGSEVDDDEPPIMCEPPQRLADAGACTGRIVGVALAANRLGESSYATAAREFNYVTAENEMKWSYNEPSPGRFDFSAGDQVASFAERNGMQIKGHALVWHNQLPGWVESLNSAQAVREAMLRHIREVMAHYRGRVRAWDVVNEAWNEEGTALRDSVFHRYLGPGFIDEAFIAAREADPAAKLYYNDFDGEDLSVKSNAIYEMVRGMVERGVPIDGVGLQMHVRIPDDEPSLEELRENMQRIADLGLDILVSEIDVRWCNGETEEQQAARYHDIIKICIEQPRCTEVTIWGITDRYSWLNVPGAPSCPNGETPHPLLWDDNYGKKLSYDAVMLALQGL